MNNQTSNSFIKNPRTNWKYILITVILAVIVGGGILGYIRDFRKEIVSFTHFPEIKKPEKVVEGEEISCISIDENLDLEKTKEINYPFADPETFEHIKKEYWIGKGKFKPFEKTEYTMELRVYNKDEEIMKTYSNWLGTSLWCFSFDNNKYVILRTFTGGAHCCVPNYIFSITPTNELKFIKNIETELDAISLSSLVFRNGKLYIRIRDSRFEYFFGPHPSAFYADEYFLIDEEKVTLDNSGFKEEYVKKAEEKTKDCFEVKNWEEQVPILCIGELVVNYLLAGEEKIAWETVEKFFTEFPNLKDNFGNKIMLEDFKKEIEERLARTVFY